MNGILEEAIIAALATAFISVPLGIVGFYKNYKQKKYEEIVSKYAQADVKNVSDVIRGNCLYYAVEKGDKELQTYLIGLIESKEITFSQGGKLFYEYAQNRDSRF